MHLRSFAILSLACGALATASCSGPPSSTVAKLKKANGGAIIQFRAGMEYAAPLSQSDAQDLVKAISSGNLLARDSRDKHLAWSAESAIRFYRGTNILGE